MTLEVTCAAALTAVPDAEWDRLLDASPGATLFHTRAWHACWLEQFGQGIEVRLWLVRRAGRLVGLWPTMVTRQRLRGCWSRRVLTPLTSLSAACGQSLGPLVQPDAQQSVAEALAGALLETRGADALYFENYLEGDPVAAVVAALNRRRPGRVVGWSGMPTHRVVLPRPEDDFRGWLAKNMRKKLARAANRLADEPSGAIEPILDAPGLDAALAAFYAQNIARMDAKGDRSTMSDPRMWAFFCALARTGLAEGRALFYVLRARGGIAGTLFAYQAGEWVGYYNGSLAPESEALSPGSLLFEQMFRSAIERGARVVDLMAGSDGYKAHWSRGNTPRLQYAALPLHPLRSLPFTVWERLKARRAPACGNGR